MTQFDDITTEGKKAILYCRVSSKKQTADGSGLDSQEHRCRQYAMARGYSIEAVFPDEISGGGDFLKRPGMMALLGFLDAHANETYVVIFDDLKRYARDTEFHLKLRREMLARNATRECLNFNFEDSPEGKFFETIVAATGTLEREQNARQVVQKMKARVEQGFWVFRAPVGYRYVKSPKGGKELVKNEPLASIVIEALEGYASSRFASQTEVRRFLESRPDFPKDKPNGEIRPETVVRFLRKEVYAGLVSVPKWQISSRQGQHEGLISLQTYERIQLNLDRGVYVPARKDIKADFPLRGAVACSCCATPLTAAWCKGKYKKYPYYFCRTKGCQAYGKTIRRDKIEGEFKELLSKLQPTKGLFQIAAAMFKDSWRMHSEQAGATVKALKRDADKAEKDIKKLIERIMDATNERVVLAYEKRIEELERDKLVFREKAAQTGKPQYTYDKLFELSLKFLSSPCKLWDSGRFELQRLVLKLAFSEHLAYSRAEGFRTPKTTLPFKVLGGFLSQENGMVPPGRIELPLPQRNGILNPARLPVPPQGRTGGHITVAFRWVNKKSRSKPPYFYKPIGLFSSYAF